MNTMKTLPWYQAFVQDLNISGLDNQTTNLIIESYLAHLADVVQNSDSGVELPFNLKVTHAPSYGEEETAAAIEESKMLEKLSKIEAGVARLEAERDDIRCSIKQLTRYVNL